MGYRLTARDLRLFAWIQSAGFVTAHHIAAWMGVKIQTASDRLRKLIAMGYVSHSRVFYGFSGCYRLTRLGAQAIDSELPILKRIPFAYYRHNTLVTELSLALVNQWGGRFVTERELYHEDGIDYFQSARPMPDGLLELSDKRIAIEVELTKKSKKRRDTIVSHYLGLTDIDEVWYFCSDVCIRRAMQQSSIDIPFIKTYLLSDYIQNNRLVAAHAFE